MSTELARRVIVLSLCSYGIKNESFHRRDEFTGISQPGGFLLAVFSGHFFPVLAFVRKWLLEGWQRWTAFPGLKVLWSGWCDTHGLITLKFREKMFICEITQKGDFYL